jgi:hypothetical protein
MVAVQAMLYFAKLDYFWSPLGASRVPLAIDPKGRFAGQETRSGRDGRAKGDIRVGIGNL